MVGLGGGGECHCPFSADPVHALFIRNTVRAVAQSSCHRFVRQLVNTTIDMASEADARELFHNVLANYKDFHLTAEERDSMAQAERDLMEGAADGFGPAVPPHEDTPYRMLVRIVFATLELKAHQMKQRFLERLGDIPIDRLPLVCNRCEVPLKDHDHSQCSHFHDAGPEADRPGL